MTVTRHERAVSHMEKQSQPVLVLEQLTKRFGETVAVDSVDLQVEQGELVTLLGPSGSGKTTILRLLAGFEVPTSGRILLGGRDVSRLAPAVRGIGMVLQHYALFPHMTVAENIAYGLKMRRWPKQKRKARVEEMLALVRLPWIADRLPEQLSGGQQQRVALARALAFDPKLLLMDEPLGALDRALRVEMEEEIRRIHRQLGTTILYVTHDQEEALALSDRIAIMNDGRIVADDRPLDLYRRPNSAFAAVFFSGSNLLPVDEVELIAEGLARVRWQGSEVTVRTSGPVEPGSAYLAVRPHSITPGTRLGAVSLGGRVRDILPLGEHNQITLARDDGTTLVARMTPEECAGMELGAETACFADPDEVVLVSRS